MASFINVEDMSDNEINVAIKQHYHAYPQSEDSSFIMNFKHADSDHVTFHLTDGEVRSISIGDVDSSMDIGHSFEFTPKEAQDAANCIADLIETRAVTFRMVDAYNIRKAYNMFLKYIKFIGASHTLNKKCYTAFELEAFESAADYLINTSSLKGEYILIKLEIRSIDAPKNEIIQHKYVPLRFFEMVLKWIKYVEKHADSDNKDVRHNILAKIETGVFNTYCVIYELTDKDSDLVSCTVSPYPVSSMKDISKIDKHMMLMYESDVKSGNFIHGSILHDELLTKRIIEELYKILGRGTINVMEEKQ